ncbi:uncharacterized protein LOC115681562 isoform X4 [Syzygium oleosum]|uniref:uncharacterized protein LOC115681562 isoform X4 n=1 Tax=Syzygium oleosum TaxID=219896 RepID=UPI0024B9944B|nr:uncharacterized protein LOC115681562 isoform X4 [Syzygium oleosum]
MVIFLFRGLTDGWRVVLTVLPKFYYKINDMLSLGHSGSGPVMFFDFLTRLYDIGGVVSVMALSSLFILMTLHGLEYSYFYEQLLASCLKSYLLLAYLAAAFAKKLRRLALSVLPAEALVIVAPFHNLLRRHPSIKCLVHREDGESEAKDDLKMEEQIVGNRNDSTGTDLPKKPGFDHFRDASGRSKSLKPEVDLKAKNMNLLYILLVPSATKIAKKIKLKFTKAWISFLRLPLPLNVYKELLVSFFKSPFLPAYLAAVFAEKLSQLALSVLPAGALVIVSPIHNLLRWHSSINCLVHRVLSATKIAKKIELKCTKAWISFLRLPLPLDVYKEVLVSLHQAVIPHLSNSIMLCNFLTRSYNIGGVVSVMALSSLFILLKQHGLEYTYFYEKLSALLQPSIFITKHRAKFYELLVSCLKSPLLPAYLAAAFAKKLSRLALSVLQAGALVIVSPIHNLFRRHPSINCLVHRESSKRMSTRSLFYFHRGHLLLLLAFVLSDTVTMALGDKGIASYYTPPYERTDCYGVGSSQFPENKLFAAVGDKLWDLGAACGREYEVRCISKAQSGPGSCKPGSGTIRVKIVDNALSVESAAAAGPKQSVTGADLVLSQTAFEAIANPSMASINVEFKEV